MSSIDAVIIGSLIVVVAALVCAAYLIGIHQERNYVARTLTNMFRDITEAEAIGAPQQRLRIMNDYMEELTK